MPETTPLLPPNSTSASHFGLPASATNSLMTLILMSLVREHGEDMDAPSGRERTVQLRRLLPAIRAMRDDIGAVGSVKTLARTCGLSVAQFRRPTASPVVAA